MKYYCEENKTFYDTPEECEAAEKQFAEKDVERKQDEENLGILIAELEELESKEREYHKEATKVRVAYSKSITDYMRKYGTIPSGVKLPSANFWNIFIR